MATIKDVAKHAGVSIMTVSRVMNNPTSVKEATRKKIQDAIDVLGYRPNRLAKSLADGRSNTIGVISSNLYNIAYTDIIAGIEEIAYKKGYVIINTNVNDYESAVNAVDILLGNQVDGIIVLPLEMKMAQEQDYHIAMEKIRRFTEYFKETVDMSVTAAVTVSELIDDVTNVKLNFLELTEKALDYLFFKGYTDIAMLNSSIDDGFWREKERIYKQMMTERGYADSIMVYRDTALVDGGYRAMEKMLKERAPRAVYCANDYLAIGALQVINKLGYKVPEDIAVIGNDDVAFCQMTYPKLTTISLNMKEAGEKAIKTMIAKLNGEKTEDEIIVSTSVIARDSV